MLKLYMQKVTHIGAVLMPLMDLAIQSRGNLLISNFENKQAIFEAIQNSKPVIVTGNTAFTYSLFMDPFARQFDLSSVRFIRVAGSVFSKVQRKTLLNALPDLTLVSNSYGCSE